MADISILGHKFSKGEAVAVGAGGLVVIYFVWKQHQASSASSASSAIDPLTGLPTSQDNAVDPLTQQTYLAEAQQYGSVAAAEAAYQSQQSADYSGVYGSGYGSYGAYGSTATPLVPSNDVQSATYASNAAWAQAVEAGLTDIGYSSTDVAAALGRYLGNLSETSTQATIVQSALAEYGPPPVGSYQVILAPTTTTTTSGNTGTGTSTDTGTTTTTSTGSTSGSTSGSTGSTASASTVSGGHVVSVNNNDAVIAWTPHGPATSWKLTITGPGAINGHTGTTTIPQGSYSGLEAGHNYEVTVQPLPSGQSGVITFKTT